MLKLPLHTINLTKGVIRRDFVIKHFLEVVLLAETCMHCIYAAELQEEYWFAFLTHNVGVES